jgi:hypothetical protein
MSAVPAREDTIPFGLERVVSEVEKAAETKARIAKETADYETAIVNLLTALNAADDIWDPPADATAAAKKFPKVGRNDIAPIFLKGTISQRIRELNSHDLTEEAIVSAMHAIVIQVLRRHPAHATLLPLIPPKITTADGCRLLTSLDSYFQKTKYQVANAVVQFALGDQPIIPTTSQPANAEKLSTEEANLIWKGPKGLYISHIKSVRRNMLKEWELFVSDPAVRRRIVQDTLAAARGDPHILLLLHEVVASSNTAPQGPPDIPALRLALLGVKVKKKSPTEAKEVWDAFSIFAQASQLTEYVDLLTAAGNEPVLTKEIRNCYPLLQSFCSSCAEPSADHKPILFGSESESNTTISNDFHEDDSPGSDLDSEFSDSDSELYGGGDEEPPIQPTPPPALVLPPPLPRGVVLSLDKVKGERIAVRGVLVEKTHFHNLWQNPTWKVSASMIDAFAALCTEYQEFALVCPTTLAYTLALPGSDFGKRKLSDDWQEKIIRSSRVIFPLHERDHWTVVQWDLDSDVLLHLNSLRQVRPSENGVLQTLVQTLERAFSRKLRVVTPPAFPQQSNSVDCGLFAIAAMFCGSFGLRWTFRQSDVPDLRAYLLRCVLKEKLFTPSFRRGLAEHKPRRDSKKAQLILSGPHFHHHVGAEAPHVEMTTASRLVGVTITPESSDIAAALTPATRKGHRRVLNLLCEELEKRPQWIAKTIPQVCVSFLATFRRKRKWTWTTTQTYAGRLIGAMRRLNQYTTPALPPIDLLAASAFSDYVRLLAKRARQNRNVEAPFLAAPQFPRVAALLPDRERAILELTWATAARPLNVAWLLAKDIVIQPNGARILWRHHKTVELTEPYTRAVHLPPDAKARLQRLLATLNPNDRLVPEEQEKKVLGTIRSALREVMGQHVTLRALRRGALTCMAQSGVPPDVLMQISGHKSLRTLRKYLSHGAFEEATHEATRKATRALW